MSSVKHLKNILEKLDNLCDKNFKNRKFKNLLQSMTIKAKLQYIINQQYVDDKLEQIIRQIVNERNHNFTHHLDDNTILFYDGFGEDFRGLAYIYLRALVNLNYKIVYVTKKEAREKQPMISTLLNRKTSKTIYVSGEETYKKLCQIEKIFEQERFSHAFFYTTPWDVAGEIAFCELENQCVRYQINLTDHAFWLGINAFDYSIEFRNYGAAISRDFRNIKEDKLLYLPYYPNVKTTAFQGFPFDVKNKKIVFSGGALYKTEDKEHLFFKLIEYIIDNHDDVIFVYAGTGHSKELDSLIRMYPDKVKQIDERKDLVEVLKRSYLYLNTYPISGALMIQYSVIANCIPITLRRKWDDDVKGILLYEDMLDEIFDDYDEVCQEIDRLLDDNEYYVKKKEILKNQVIGQEAFENKLRSIICSPKENTFIKIDSVNTELYQKQFLENTKERDIVDVIVSHDGKCLWYAFPMCVIKKVVFKIKDIL